MRYEEECVQEIFGKYIIGKIHKEDLSLKVKMSPNEDDIEGKINLKEKINITSLILENKELLVQYEIFYEEDCQLSLLNWGYKCSKLCNLVENNILYRKNLEVLLYNIINIFEIFPIKPNDLISLNFIEKLNKIKYTVKNFNIGLYSKIKNLINYWEILITYYNSYLNKKVSNNLNLLNKKRQREEYEENLSIISSNETLDTPRNSDMNIIKIKKCVSWKENNLLIEYSQFDPNKSPLEHN